MNQLVLCEVDEQNPFPSAPPLELLPPPPPPSAPPLSVLTEQFFYRQPPTVVLKPLPPPPDLSAPPSEPDLVITWYIIFSSYPKQGEVSMPKAG